MKIFILSVLLYQFVVKASTEVKLPVDLYQQESENSEIFLNQEDPPSSIQSLYKNKLPMYFNNLSTEQAKRIVEPEEITLQQRAVARSVCSCETDYEIRDLGAGNYPRYLTSSRCKSKTCQNKFNSCRLLQYRVPVLRQRRAEKMPETHYSEDRDFPEILLPESLRRKWELRSMSIPVACIRSN